MRGHQLDFFTDPDKAIRRTSARRRLHQPPLATADGLVPDDEGLFARVIKRHSIEKAHEIGRFADAASIAVGGKLPIYWVELFAGPGRLMVSGSDEFLPGSPMQALGVRGRFAGYFFADRSIECVRCLRARTRGREGVHVHQGDANDAETLDMVSRIIPRHALVIAYLDPQGLDLHLDTVRALAWRYRRLDLLINLPINGLVRYLMAPGNEEKAREVLGHPDPRTFMAHGPRNGARDIRRWYSEQLAGLGFRFQIAHTIRTADKKAGLYDVVIAGRHRLTAELFERASTIGAYGELQLDLSG